MAAVTGGAVEVQRTRRAPPQDQGAHALVLVLVFLLAIGIALLAMESNRLAVVALGGAVAMLFYLLLTEWSSIAAFAGFWIWVHLEDLIRAMTGNFLVFWVKDLLLLALVIGCIRARGLAGFQTRILGLPLVLYAAWVLVQMANPAITDPLVPLVGIHAKLLYIPLFFVAIAYFDSERKLRGFLLFLTVAVGFESTIALMQYFREPTWWSTLMGIDLDLDFVRLRSFEGGGLLRTASIFIPGRFHQFVLLVSVVLLGAQAVLSKRPLSRWAWMVSLTMVFAGGVALQSSRTVFYLFSIGGALLMLHRSGSRHSVSSAIAVTIGLVAMLALWVPRIDARIHQHYFAPASLSIDPDQYDSVGGRVVRGLHQLDASITSSGFLGHGTGTSSQGLHHVTQSLAIPKENGYAALIWELGILGPVLWLLLMGSVLRAVWRAYCSIQSPAHRQLGFSVVLTVVFAFILQYIGLQYMENYLVTMHFWTFAGMAVALPRIAAERQRRIADPVPT